MPLVIKVACCPIIVHPSQKLMAEYHKILLNVDIFSSRDGFFFLEVEHDFVTDKRQTLLISHTERVAEICTKIRSLKIFNRVLPGSLFRASSPHALLNSGLFMYSLRPATGSTAGARTPGPGSTPQHPTLTRSVQVREPLLHRPRPD